MKIHPRISYTYFTATLKECLFIHEKCFILISSLPCYSTPCGIYLSKRKILIIKVNRFLLYIKKNSFFLSWLERKISLISFFIQQIFKNSHGKENIAEMKIEEVWIEVRKIQLFKLHYSKGFFFRLRFMKSFLDLLM